jgi:hypothetical protein
MNCSIHEMSNDKKTLKPGEKNMKNTGQKTDQKTQEIILSKEAAEAQISLCLRALPLEERRFNLDAMASMIAKHLVMLTNNNVPFTPAQRERAAGNIWMK